MKFQESALAHKYLDGLDTVIEIGASAHNPFNIKCGKYVNVDFTDESEFHAEQLRMCGEVAEVHLISPGDKLNLPDASVDGVINSHVIEHFFDPIGAIKEWLRVLKPGGILFMSVPHKERTFDSKKDLTPVSELILRHKGVLTREDYPQTDDHDHWNIWNTDSFLYLMRQMNFNVVEYLDVDDKVGNGFMVVIKKLKAKEDT